MRLIVCGPLKFEDYSFVKKKLNWWTRKAKDIVLISDQRIDHESTSSFPLAERWLIDRWKRFRSLEHPSNRFSTVIRHYAPYEDDKQWSKGVKERRLSMVRDATHLIAFWDVGGKDRETEAMMELAQFYDLKVIKVLI